MKVRSVDISATDIASSSIFFRTLTEFFDLTRAEVLDAFARDGTITVSQYQDRVGAIDTWELMDQHRARLSQYNVRDMKFGCSYWLQKHSSKKYDMVVIDTPQGLHDDSKGNIHVEHFDFLASVGHQLKDKAIVVLYVNRRPYDKSKVGSHGYDEYEAYDFTKWMAARSVFYQHDPREITEEAAVKAYRGSLLTQGFAVKSVTTVPCWSDVKGLPPYAFRVGLEVEKIR